MSSNAAVAFPTDRHKSPQKETPRAKGLKTRNVPNSVDTRGTLQPSLEEPSNQNAILTVPQQLGAGAPWTGPSSLYDRVVSQGVVHSEAGLDLHLLEDSCIPEHQKLRHVLNWAESFIRTEAEMGHSDKKGDTEGHKGCVLKNGHVTPTIYNHVTSIDSGHVSLANSREVPYSTSQVTLSQQPHYSPQLCPSLKLCPQPCPSPAEKVKDTVIHRRTQDLPAVDVASVHPTTSQSLYFPPGLSVYEKYLMCMTHLNSYKTQGCVEPKLSTGKLWEETGIAQDEGDRDEAARKIPAQWSWPDHPSSTPGSPVDNGVKVEESISIEENHHNTKDHVTTELPVTAPVNHVTTELPVTAPVNHVTIGRPVTAPVNHVTTGHPVTAPVNHVTTGRPVTASVNQVTTEHPVTAPVSQVTTELPVIAPLNHVTTGRPVTAPVSQVTTELPFQQKCSDTLEFPSFPDVERKRPATEAGSEPKGRKAAGVRPRRTVSSGAGQLRHRRFWETSSILWSSYSQGALLPRSKPPGRTVTAVDAVQQESPTGSESRPLKTSIHPETPPKKHPKGGSILVPWLSLPDELWMCILKLLPPVDLSHIAQTCHQLCRLGNDSTLWEVVRIENTTCLNDDWLSSIGRRCPRSLTLFRCTDSSVTPRGLAELFSQCNNSLKELRIMSCSGPGLQGDRLLVPCSWHCTHLTSVDVSWTGATDIGIIAIASASYRLQSVGVSGCQLVTDRSLKVLSRRHGESLHRLEAFGCQNLSSACLSVMAANCPNLRVLNIGKLPKVTEACVNFIISTLKKLTSLNVTGLPVVQDGTVHQIARQCSDLQCLTLSCCPHITDISLREISTYSPSIRYLDVSGCWSVTDSGVGVIAKACHHLQYIDLSSTKTSNKGVCLLANYCYRHLQTVKLSFCYICQDALRKLCRYCKRLRLLHLYGACDFHNVQEFRQINQNLEAKCDLNCTPEQHS